MPGMKYRHPYDELIIQDNTGYIETLAPQNNGTILLSAFLSSKGENNVMKTFTDQASFIKEYGKPKFKEHGQSIYNIINWLGSGGMVQCMRVTANDANHANILILVKVKKTVDAPVLDVEGRPLYITPDGEVTVEADGATPYTHDEATIKIITKTVENLTDVNMLLPSLKSEYSDVVDSDGYKTYPLMAICDKGAGKSGNSVFFRINRNIINDNETDYANYNIESLENNNGISIVDKSTTVTLYPEGINQYNETEFIEDIVKDKFTKINLYFDDIYYDALCAELESCIDNLDGNISEIDPLFAIDKRTGRQYKFISIDNDSVVLNGLSGMALLSGNDGAFDITSPVRDSAISSRLIEAYSGDIDSSIINSKNFPANVMLDANFDLETKMAMILCKTKRGGDAQVILDSGIIGSVTAAISWRETAVSFDDYEVKLYPQHLVVVDPYTSKDIKVTMTYMLSKAIPEHDNSYGSHIPLAEKYCEMYGHKKGTLLPVPVTPDEREELYVRQLNYCEESGEYIVPNTDITAQKKSSDFSNGNNVRVLLEIKKMLRDLIPTWRYDFMSENDLERFNREANEVVKSRFLDPGKCGRAVVEVSSSPDQMRKKILQISLGTSFYPIVERTLQYIMVNPY